jgi:2-methylcitrate dehydratase PrpD
MAPVLKWNETAPSKACCGTRPSPGTVVIPAALAVAEDVGASGREFLTSVIAGYELMVRAGLGVGALSHMMGGFHATGTNGVFGAAASTARLLDLDAAATAHAFGVSGSLAGGIMEFSQSGGMVKRLHAGRAAEGGVLAGYLASDGFTGPTTVLEGPFGYCETFSSKPERERLLAELGRKFAVEEITIKPYACCSDLHGTIDCIRAIRAQAAIETEQIRRITIHTYDKVIRQNSGDGSSSVMAAQYSILFTAAASLFYDLGDPRSYSEDVIVEPRIAELVKRTELKRDDAFQALYPRKMPTRVVVEMAGGQEYSAEVIGAKGHFENPLSREEVEAKFRLLTADIISPAKVDEAIAAIDALDTATSVDRLVKALAPLSNAQEGSRDAG